MMYTSSLDREWAMAGPGVGVGVAVGNEEGTGP